jgi:hypothetical protein
MRVRCWSLGVRANCSAENIAMDDSRERRPGEELLEFAHGKRYSTVLADPPWRFSNRTGKMAPEHRRLSRYPTMGLQDIVELPVPQLVRERAHLHLWVPNAKPTHWMGTRAAHAPT